jgi:hypothetical protein
MFWSFASKQLLLLMNPFPILANFEAILLPHFVQVYRVREDDLPDDPPLRRYARIMEHNSVVVHWTIEFVAHQFPPHTKSPHFLVQFYIGRDEDLHTRRWCIEIDHTGFHMYSYQATFRKRVNSFESLQTLLLAFSKLNEQALIAAKREDGEWA